MPDERRVQLRCSAGCLMLWHQECWRKFQDGFEHETRSPATGVGTNLTQARGLLCAARRVLRCVRRAACRAALRTRRRAACSRCLR